MHSAIQERLLSPSLPSNRSVAQTGSLPFRRLAVGRPVGCQPATQQTASLRYVEVTGQGARKTGKEVPVPEYGSEERRMNFRPSASAVGRALRAALIRIARSATPPDQYR